MSSKAEQFLEDLGSPMDKKARAFLKSNKNLKAALKSLRAADQDFSSMEYDPEEEPSVEAMHSVLVTLWSALESVMTHRFESAAKEMGSTGRFMLRELV